MSLDFFFPKDRPGHLSNCALVAVLLYCAAHEQAHTGQHGEARDRWQITGIRASKLSRRQRITYTWTPPTRKDDEGYVHLIFTGTYPPPHTEVPAPLIYSWLDTGAMTTYWPSSQVFHPLHVFFFVRRGCWFNIQPYWVDWPLPFPLITKAWHFSLSPNLIYAQFIHSSENQKV